MRNDTLLVPVFIDGLCLAHGTMVNGALVDFRSLPYVGRDADGLADMNAGTPWLGTYAARQPLAGRDTWLPAGVHLHWALPDALSHARKRSDDPAQITFPAAPDRWLVTRWSGETVQRRWLVESNYLWPHDQDWSDPAIGEGNHPELLVSYLLPDSLRQRGLPPWRYLGRRHDLDAKKAPRPPEGHVYDLERYLDGLTAVGYGEGHFAAYYPSCRGVFGFHDSETTETSADLRYEVFGWYSRDRDDPLWRLHPLDDGAWNDWLRKELAWSVGALPAETAGALPAEGAGVLPAETAGVFPAETAGVLADEAPAAPGQANHTCCFAQITAAGLDGPTPPAVGVTLALAENHVESLAALVATELSAGDGGPDKASVETFLESLLVAEDLSRDTFDLGPRTAAALHRRSFDTTLGDPIWAVRVEVIGSKDAATGVVGLPSPGDTAEAPELTLPDAVALLLNRLNDAQRELTGAEQEVAAARHQLHLDWARSLHIKYPPADQADSWSDAIAGHDVDLVRHWLTEVPLRAVTEREAGRAARLTERDTAKGALDAAVACHNDAVASGTDRWLVVQIQGPRFHQPCAPSITVAGLDDAATDRHHGDGDASEDGTLVCTLAPGFAPELLQIQDFNLSAARAGMGDLTRSEGAGLRRSVRHHPLFLEWQAEISPLVAGNSVDPSCATIDPALILLNFDLAEGDTEIQRRPDSAVMDTASSTLRGRGFMARGVQDLAQSRLESWLARRLRDNTTLPEASRTLAFAREHLEVVKGSFPDGDDARLALDIWRELEKHPVFSQSLAGFNEALLMLRPDSNLVIEDPLGFDDEQELATRVRIAVDDWVRVGDGWEPRPGAARARTTPNLDADYLPVRTGDLGLTEVHLVDIWGRLTELPVDAVVTSQRLASGRRLPVALPARIAQPCRLSLRWLDAVHDEQEMNTHPASSPICGWLVPDTLEGSVAVYDADGAPQGQVDHNGDWRISPGAGGGAVRPADLPNPHLVQVVEWMVRRTPDEIGAFVDTVESALENIAPPPTRQQEARALLMGRPVAVVRARTTLELNAPYARDQSMLAFSRTLSAFRQERTRRVHDALGDGAADVLVAPNPTHGFEYVAFPIRIGEHLRLNDGVVGYFVEDPDDGSFVDEMFWSPQGRSDFTQSDHIDVFEEGGETADHAFDLWHSLADPPIVTTVLLDPRAALHASCGVLPGKAVRIPPQQYERALHAIGLTFRAAPVLSPAEQLEVPLPTVAGWSWSWLSREGGRWQRIAHDATIGKSAVADAFADRPGLWEELHAAGWLELWPDHPEHARVVAATRRPELPEGLKERSRAIASVLSTAGRCIVPPTTDARFAPGLRLREGWLQLSPEE